MDSEKKRVSERMPQPSPGSDINFGVVVKAGLVLVAIAVVVHVLMLFMFRYLHQQEVVAEKQVSPLIPKQAPLPPEPRLQETPPLDLAKVRKQEDEILNSYGWVSPEKGIVRIPIDRAMKLFVEKQKLEEAGKMPALQNEK